MYSGAESHQVASLEDVTQTGATFHEQHIPPMTSPISSMASRKQPQTDPSKP